MITVEQCLRLPVFGPSVLLAGHQGLQHPVRWAHVVDEPNVSFWVVPELIVFTTGRNNTDTNYWESIVTDLSNNKVSGLVIALGKYIKTIPTDALKLASERALPIIALPWDLPFIQVTEAIHKQIIMGHISEWKKVSNLQLQMTSAVKNASSLQDLVRRFSLLSRLPVQIVPSNEDMPTESRKYHVPTPDHSHSRWYLAVNKTSITTADDLLLQQMTSLCSLYLVRQQLSKQHEWELQASFLDQLIDSSASSHEQSSLIIRIRNWGFPTGKKVRLILLTLPDSFQPIEKSRNVVTKALAHFHNLVTIRGDMFIIVIAETVKHPAINLTTLFEEYFRQFPVCQGVASHSISQADIPESFATLQKILAMAPVGKISPLSDLIFPQIVSELPHELMLHFSKLTWYRLADPVLKETLLALINSGGHRTRTSEALGIHRNTLRGRIEAIETILERPLTSEFLTQLHLAMLWDNPTASTKPNHLQVQSIAKTRTMH